MNEILTTALTALVLLAGLAALIWYASRDVFLGPAPTPRAADDPFVLKPSRMRTLQHELNRL